jgi:hypothetical protein
MTLRPTRFIAIDWSGAALPAGQRKHIVAADWRAGNITVTSGRTREETIAWLIEQARLTPNLAVGLDFAFSYPAWFVTQQGAATIEDFWRIVAERGEHWLADCTEPFWGRPGRRCPAQHRAPHWHGFRRADQLSSGKQPSSPFQIGGAGAVGTGSLRGIPCLLTLREARFSIWPFHKPAFPMAMEIYPRSFTGPVVKSSREAREAYLHAHIAPGTYPQAAIDSEDAFDAFISAIGMQKQAQQIARVKKAVDETALLEGEIFPGTPITNPLSP